MVMTAAAGFIALLFLVDPIRVIGWGRNPLNRMYAEQFLSAVVRSDYTQASASLGRREAMRSEWVGQMEKLKERGFYPVRFEKLKVPHDRKHMDGRAVVTFHVDGKEETYDALITFSPGGVGQTCIFNPGTEYTKAWNRINCHY